MGIFWSLREKICQLQILFHSWEIFNIVGNYLVPIVKIFLFVIFAKMGTNICFCGKIFRLVWKKLSCGQIYATMDVFWPLHCEKKICYISWENYLSFFGKNFQCGQIFGTMGIFCSSWKKIATLHRKIYDCGQIFVVIAVGITLPTCANICTAPWENFLAIACGKNCYCGKIFATMGIIQLLWVKFCQLQRSVKIRFLGIIYTSQPLRG